MTSRFRKGTVPFPLRENRDSPQVIEGVREFETPGMLVRNGLCAVRWHHRSRRNGTEAVPYSLEFPDTVK